MKAQIIKQMKFQRPLSGEIERMVEAIVKNLIDDSESGSIKINKSSPTKIHKGLKPRQRQKLRQAKEISLVFVNSRRMRELNRRFRGGDYATDVLSFAATAKAFSDCDRGSLPPFKNLSLGELVFCVPVVKAQAKEHGLTVKDEFLYLLIHGLLHLLGYDHETNAKAAREMYRLQDQLFERLRDS